MSHSHLLAATALLAAAFFSATNVFAHGRDDGPLFVAEDGTDSGSCTDESAPCGSLSYALGMAGKGSELRVAEGTYPVHNPEDLFHVVSGMIDVTGGFIRRGGHFAGRSGISTLTGVPPQFRDLLKDRGFHVVADRKAIEGPKVGQAERLISLHQKLKSGGAPASPCTDGMAGDLSCEAVDLLAHFSFTDVSAKPASATDVWGFLDLNTGREYAIVGYNSGTAVIDVTDPENLGEVDFIAGQPAGWRDIKVYQHFDDAAARWRAFAYVTTDGSTDGLFVIDMSGLPHSIRKTSYTSDFAAAHNAYLTNSDYGTGLSLTTSTPLLVIAGSNLSGGQYRSYSLANPASPEFVGGASAADYMHDASSAVIRDARKDSQCVNAVDWCEVLFDFNENTIDIWDVTEAENAQRLSSTAYENAAYVHSGWWSEDKRYLFVHDEQDEQHLGLNTNLRVFSISDLRSPVLVGSWEGPSRAIDHNGYTRGNRYYMSNYSRGLTVLDISDPASPVTAGSLDTYPFSDSSSFVGAWGTFPFFRSGTVAISDIDSGLYLTRDGSLEVPQGSFRFAAPSSAGSEGETVQLVVERSAGSEGHASVQYEVVHATADGTDYQLASATLQWPDKDSANRLIDIPHVNDGSTEGLEDFLVRLTNPGGGATLARENVASVYVSDPAAVSEVGFFSDSVEVAEDGFGTAVIVLRRGGSAVEAVSVDFAAGGGNAIAQTDFDGPTVGTVSWAAGDGRPKNLLFDIIDDDSSESTESFEIRLSNAVGTVISGPPTATVRIADAGGSDADPTPAPDTGRSGGGSSFALLVLLCLRLLPAVLRAYRRDAA